MLRKSWTRLPVVMLSLVPGGMASAAEVGCRAFVADYVSWAKAKVGVNAVGAKLGGVKLRDTNPTSYPWGHGSYAESRLGLHGNELEGRFKVVFSDRKAGIYRFDPARADLQDVRLFADGRVRVVLVTWGHASIFLEDVKCYAGGFLTGIKKEGNGVSMVTLLLRKEVMRPGDGFRDWP